MDVLFILQSLIIFLVILSILVLIHEAGHFFMAKKYGVKVEEFGLGFPPRAWGIKKGETLYSINWLPIGGFVRLYGEDAAGAGEIKTKKHIKDPTKLPDYHRMLISKSPWQQSAIIVAGVVMNMILAIVLYYIFLSFVQFRTIVPKIGSYTFFGVNQQDITRQVPNAKPIVGQVSPGSPAEKIGIQPNSQILTINGKPVATSQDLIQTVNSYKGKEITIVWENLKTKAKQSSTVIPRVSPPQNQGALGIAIASTDSHFLLLEFKTPLQKLFSGITYSLNLIGYQAEAFGVLIGRSVAQHSFGPIGNAVSGPIGIGVAVGGVAKIPDFGDRMLSYINIAGLISVMLAFANVLPIPALDGGRLFFRLFEGITGFRISPDLEARIHSVGLAVVLVLFVLIAYLDIARFFLKILPAPAF